MQYKRLGSWNYDKLNRPSFHVDTLHDPGIRIEMIDLIFNLSCWYLIGSEINFWWYPIDRTQSSGSIIITHSFRVYHTHRSFKCARLQWLNRIIPTEPSTRTKFTQDCSLHVPYIGTYCLCNFIQFRRGIRHVYRLTISIEFHFWWYQNYRTQFSGSTTFKQFLKGLCIQTIRKLELWQVKSTKIPRWHFARSRNSDRDDWLDF